MARKKKKRTYEYKPDSLSELRLVTQEKKQKPGKGAPVDDEEITQELVHKIIVGVKKL